MQITLQFRPCKSSLLTVRYRQQSITTDTRDRLAAVAAHPAAMSSFIISIPLVSSNVRPSLSSSSSSPMRTIATKRTRRITINCSSADVAETDAKESQIPTLQLAQGMQRSTYEWNGHEISYIRRQASASAADMPAIVLVHGFGGSALHWRSTLAALSNSSSGYDGDVYSVDLLGFGYSDKPPLEYSIDLWRDQISHFATSIATSQEVILVGNSIGSLASLSAATNSNNVRAVALMNCAGGLVSFRESEVSLPVKILIRVVNAVLFNPVVGGLLFRWIRTPKNLRNVLKEIYANSDRVDDELVNIISAPAFTDGACEVFLSVFNAKDAGPTPESLLARCTDIPICVIWGEQDLLTPLRTGVHPGINFPRHHPNLTLHPIESCGHCPFDDSPAEVESILLPFLKQQST